MIPENAQYLSGFYKKVEKDSKPLFSPGQVTGEYLPASKYSQFDNKMK